MFLRPASVADGSVVRTGLRNEEKSWFFVFFIFFSFFFLLAIQHLFLTTFVHNRGAAGLHSNESECGSLALRRVPTALTDDPDETSPLPAPAKKLLIPLRHLPPELSR